MPIPQERYGSLFPVSAAGAGRNAQHLGTLAGGATDEAGESATRIVMRLLRCRKLVALVHLTQVAQPHATRRVPLTGH
jgi:hypothetical protein